MSALITKGRSSYMTLWRVSSYHQLYSSSVLGQFCIDEDRATCCCHPEWRVHRSWFPSHCKHHSHKSCPLESFHLFHSLAELSALAPCTSSVPLRSDLEGIAVGSVCSLSVFDFEHHGNSKYGSPFHTSKDRRSSQGKMEKSFISFKSNYPNWEPDGNGKHLLSVLADFRTRREDLALFNLAHANSVLDARMRSIPRMGDSLYQRASDSSSRDRFGQRMPLSRSHPIDEVQDSAQFRENYGGSSIQQTDQMYWLDRFYTASQTAEPSVTSHTSVDQRTNFESERQVGGNFQASISDSEMQENAPRPGIIQQIPGQGGESRWWDRRGPGSAMVPESTFEPPMFGGVGMLEESPDDYYESEEDHERSWINRRHSGSAYLSQQISDDEASHLDLPFGDAFDKPRDVSGAGERPTSSNSRH